jgi:hypothetical protein
VITVTRVDGPDLHFDTATRVSTDEFNNLEVWAGRNGDMLLWLCAGGHWIDVLLEPDGE